MKVLNDNIHRKIGSYEREYSIKKSGINVDYSNYCINVLGGLLDLPCMLDSF